MSTSDEWLARAAEVEDQVGSVSVGGLACDVGWHKERKVSITLEEIVQILDASLARKNWKMVEDVAFRILDFKTERDQPVTREWLESIASQVDEVHIEPWFVIGKLPGKVVYATVEGDSVVIWHCIGSVLSVCHTRGQLLDLLSGLGVKK